MLYFLEQTEYLFMFMVVLLINTDSIWTKLHSPSAQMLLNHSSLSDDVKGQIMNAAVMFVMLI